MTQNNTGTQLLKNDTLTAVDYDTSEVNLRQFAPETAQIQINSGTREVQRLFHQDIKTQHELARKTLASQDSKKRRKGKQKPLNATSFDIKVRKFVYSGVPEESANSLHNKAIQ